MDVSVVIVNYNVKYFVEQCILSVVAASSGISVEIIVVDNRSSDDSVRYLTEKFPDVTFISNTENVGFSKANNQAMKAAKGKYVLILNPDTVIAEDTLHKCIAFMKQHADAGALGVKMIDGTGTFLPESKRALPTPEVAFYKIFGLSALFPSSKIFGQYHLGFLDKNKTHAVDILSGAFMFFDKKVLDQIGYFDETFFMYGEDIDLSYRVILAGYKNYYFADTTIIHYKGESTKKGSLNYVKVFYQAMIIFAKKHFVQKRASLFAVLINIAVVFRAIVTLLVQLLSSSALYIIDGLLGYAALYFITNYWAAHIKHIENYYPMKFLGAVIPAYILCWITAVYFSEGYEKPFRLNAIIKGILFSTILVAAVYGFLPESWRFSRAIILLGAVALTVVMFFTRTIYNLLRHERFSFDDDTKDTVLLFCDETEVAPIEKIVQTNRAGCEVLRSGNINNVTATLAIFSPAEAITSASVLSYKTIISIVAENARKYKFKIYNPTMNVVIGSDSKNTAGDSYAANAHYRLNKNIVRTQKRIADVVLSTIFLPFLLLKKDILLTDYWHLIKGQKTLVGYLNSTHSTHLPKLPYCIFPAMHKNKEIPALSEEEILYLNTSYAKHYTVSTDFYFLWENIF